MSSSIQVRAAVLLSYRGLRQVPGIARTRTMLLPWGGNLRHFCPTYLGLFTAAVILTGARFADARDSILLSKK